MSIEHKIDFGGIGFKWSADKMSINTEPALPQQEKLSLRAQAQSAYLRLCLGIDSAKLWVAKHPNETRLALLATSLALGAIYELSNSDLANALQNTLDCNDRPLGAHPDGGYCSLQCSPDGISPIRVFEGSCQPWQPADINQIPTDTPAIEILPTPTNIPTAEATQPNVVFDSGNADSIMPTPTLTPSTESGSGSEPIYAVLALIAASGLLAFRNFLKRSAGTHQTREEIADEAFKAGLGHAKGIDDARKKDARVLKEADKAERAYRRKHRI